MFKMFRCSKCTLGYFTFLPPDYWKQFSSVNNSLLCLSLSPSVFFFLLFFFVVSNPEYKDTPIDITQLPNLPEKASESSETSDSESDSKDNSGTVQYYFKSGSYTYHELITYKYSYYSIIRSSQIRFIILAVSSVKT